MSFHHLPGMLGKAESGLIVEVKRRVDSSLAQALDRSQDGWQVHRSQDGQQVDEKPCWQRPSPLIFRQLAVRIRGQAER